jgi:hypothetical protein
LPYTAESAAAVGLQRRHFLEERLAIETIAPLHDVLVEQRALFVQKELANTLTDEETRRLAYIRWQLDQYESAMLGPDFRQLAAIANAQSALAKTVDEFARIVAEKFPRAVQGRRR